MKILFLGNINNPLLQNLAAGLKKKNNCSIDIISDKEPGKQTDSKIFDDVICLSAESYLYKIPKLKMLLYGLAYLRILKKLKRQYDICHIHYLSGNYFLSVNEIKKRSKKLIVTVFGSEYYKSSSLLKFFQKKIAKEANVITFANENTLRAFHKTFSVKRENLIIQKYGLTILDTIKKLKDIPVNSLKQTLHFSRDAFVITCGTNGSPHQQHIKIIEALQNIKTHLPDNYIFVFPLTYGGEKTYIQKLESILKISGLKYILFTTFLDENKLSSLRLVTDILIQVQTSDQLSGAMQEHLYARNVVITGSWLPYEEFLKNEVFFETINSPEDLDKKLLEIIQNISLYRDKVKNNPEKIYLMSGQENTINSWVTLYNK